MQSRNSYLYCLGLLTAGLSAIGQQLAGGGVEPPSYELISVARLGDRATAVIVTEDGRKRLLELGEELGGTGYVLSVVDAQYVELTRDGQTMTLTIDRADEASIARRKAARRAAEAADAAEEEAVKEAIQEAAEKTPRAQALLNLRQNLNRRMESWQLEGADVQAIAAALREWTTSQDTPALMVRVLDHPNADPVAVSASGADNTVTDVLNMLYKDFKVPYAATPDGKVLLGNGYSFKRHVVRPDENPEAVAKRYSADAGLIGEINGAEFQPGKAVIVPVPVHP